MIILCVDVCGGMKSYALIARNGRSITFVVVVVMRMIVRDDDATAQRATKRDGKNDQCEDFFHVVAP
jgi:hypothetical protein